MEPLKRKKTNLSIEEKKEVVLLDRCNPSWTQQQLANEFNQKHVEKDWKRNRVSQILKDFVTIRIFYLRDRFLFPILQEVGTSKSVIYKLAHLTPPLV